MPKNICLKVIVIARLKFEGVYYDVGVQNTSRYATMTTHKNKETTKQTKRKKKKKRNENRSIDRLTACIMKSQPTIRPPSD